MCNRKMCLKTSIPSWIKVSMAFYFFILSIVLGNEIASADDWIPPHHSDTSSENGSYVFHISPTFGGNRPLRPGTCKGTLDAKDGKEFKLIWDRPLINDVCPILAVVSNSGKYVITIGEWYGFRRLPIVVYGIEGRLINVYGELEQIIPYYIEGPDHGFATGNGLSSSIGGRDWLSNSLLFFDPSEDFFIVRMSNKETMVFETKSGRLTEDTWKKFNSDSDKIEKYDALKKNLGRLIITKALQLVSSDQSEEQEKGLFVLNQCKDSDSIKVLEDALKDPTSKIIDNPQGKVRKYPIRKAASEALKSIGEIIPENVVTEERVEEE
jgi:hypothetical protein